MNITDFIKRELLSFLDRFKTAKVKFGVDRIANVYTVEVYPSGLLEKDDVFEWADSLVTESINQFPDELLCIREEDIILGVGDLLFEKEGMEFNPISAINISLIPHANIIGVQCGVFTAINLGQGFQRIDESANSSFIEIAQTNDYPLAA